MRELQLTLKSLRALKDMTQKQFAEFVGIDYRRYQSLESGDVVLSAKELMIISSKMNILPSAIKLD